MLLSVRFVLGLVPVEIHGKLLNTSIEVKLSAYSAAVDPGWMQGAAVAIKARFIARSTRHVRPPIRPPLSQWLAAGHTLSRPRHRRARPELREVLDQALVRGAHRHRLPLGGRPGLFR